MMKQYFGTRQFCLWISKVEFSNEDKGVHLCLIKFWQFRFSASKYDAPGMKISNEHIIQLQIEPRPQAPKTRAPQAQEPYPAPT